VTVVDRSVAAEDGGSRKADPANPDHVGAPMPGKVIATAVQAGDAVAEGDALVTLEAMKMETVVRAHRAGTVAEVLTAEGRSVQGGDLLLLLS
jgi:pyruvate carboxylase